MPQFNYLNVVKKKHKRMSTDEEQSVEVYEKNQENDPDPNSTEIMANHIKTELNDNA